MKKIFVFLMLFGAISCGTVSNENLNKDQYEQTTSSFDFQVSKAVLELRSITTDPKYLEFLQTEDAEHSSFKPYARGINWLRKYRDSVTDKAIEIIQKRDHEGS